SSSVAPTRKWTEMRTRESSSPRGSRCPIRSMTIRKPRIADGRFLRSSTDADRQFREVRVNVEVVPKLCGHHRGKATLHGKTQQPRRHLAESAPPVMHRGCVEIARAA